MHVAEGRGVLIGGGEGRSSGGQAVTEPSAKPGLENRQLTSGQLYDLLAVGVRAGYLEAEGAMHAACVMPRYPVPSTVNRGWLVIGWLLRGSQRPSFFWDGRWPSA